MTSHESFYRAVKDAGGMLDPKTETPPYDQLSQTSLSVVEQMRDGINKRSDIVWPLGDIRVAIVSNPTFNAFAHHDQGQEGIAIYSGLFYLLVDLSATLWSHGAFLKRTHPIMNDKPDLDKIIERFRPLQTKVVWNGPIGTYPNDQERAHRSLSFYNKKREKNLRFFPFTESRRARV